MQVRVGLEGWIEIYAKFGERTAVLKVWKSQVPREILKLEEEGFVITYLCAAEVKNQDYYKFDWSKPTIEGKLAS